MSDSTDKTASQSPGRSWATLRKGCLLCLIVCWSLTGCAGQGNPSAPASKSDSKAKPAIVGSWSSSTSPEMAASAHTMTFLESGEWQSSSPALFEGRPLTAKIDGKEQVIRGTVGGTWDMNGDQLRVHITQSNIAGFKPDADHSTYQVIEITERKLILQKEAHKETLFRVK